VNEYRLFSHFLIINLAGLGLLLLAYFNGWFDRVIEADSSYISLVILGLFIFALFSATRHVLTLSNELDRLDAGDSEQLEQLRRSLKRSSNALRALEIQVFSRISHLRTIGNGLVVLGLIGTVVGFIIVAAGIDAESAGDVNRVGSLIGVLLHGLGVAFYTTLVGAVFSLWLSLNYQILHSGAAALLAALMAESDPVPVTPVVLRRNEQR
jgi:biopolymer transport protein ExbB/TolQ